MMGTPRGKNTAKGKSAAATGAGSPLQLVEESASVTQPKKQGPLPPHLRPGFDESSDDTSSSDDASSSSNDDDSSSSNGSSSSEEAQRSREGTEDGSDAHSSGPDDPCVLH